MEQMGSFDAAFDQNSRLLNVPFKSLFYAR
jgi:hypothetical protein